MLPKRLERTVIYENPWVNLYVDKVLFPDGRVIEKHHFLHYDSEAVGVIIENDRGEILLINAYRYVTNSTGWEIPAGGVENSETPLVAAKREVLEETGYNVTEPKFIYSYNPSNGMSDEVVNIVRCKAINNIDKFDKNEVKEFKWFPVGKIKEMIRKNEIKCGLSLLGLLLVISGIEED